METYDISGYKCAIARLQRRLCIDYMLILTKSERKQGEKCLGA